MLVTVEMVLFQRHIVYYRPHPKYEDGTVFPECVCPRGGSFPMVCSPRFLPWSPIQSPFGSGGGGGPVPHGLHRLVWIDLIYVYLWYVDLACNDLICVDLFCKEVSSLVSGPRSLPAGTLVLLLVLPCGVYTGLSCYSSFCFVCNQGMSDLLKGKKWQKWNELLTMLTLVMTGWLIAKCYVTISLFYHF